MAALVEGQTYGLSSFSSTSAGKTALHVKLTDSALKAIEEFNHQKAAGTSRRPKIQFQGTQGSIQIPGRKSSSDPEGWRTFSFSLAPAPGDLKGSFDCVRQTKTSSGEPLCLVGGLTNRISVHATDDVYNTTREKMAIAEEESKKFCAKEIKPGGKNFGRKVKRVLKSSEVPSKPVPSLVQQSRGGGPSAPMLPAMTKKPSPATSAGETMTRGPSPVPHKPHRPVAPPSNPHHPNPHHPNPHHQHQQQHSSSSPQHQQPQQQQQQQQSQQQQQQQNNTTSSSSNNSGSSSKPSSHAKPEIMKKPLRERIIHLLALRPYKRPEIMIRLQREGIREKDRNSITSILSQVGQFNKDNTYTLAKTLYAEVKSNWVGYREEDKKLLKRKLDTLERATPSPAISPVHSNNSNSSPPQKRSSSEVDTMVEPTSKKPRVAHVRPEPREQQQQQQAPEPIKREADSSLLTFKHSQTAKEEVPLSSQENQHPYKPKVDTVASTENQDFVQAYSEIECATQRQKYKLDFNEEYNEYRLLHGNLEKKTHIFHELKNKLYQEQRRGCEENLENIKNKILMEYKQLRSDQKYIEQRKRCDYLHKKLAHIKKLIAAFDHSHNSSSSNSTPGATQAASS